MQKISNINFPRPFLLNQTSICPVKNVLIIFSTLSDIPAELSIAWLREEFSQQEGKIATCSISFGFGDKRVYIQIPPLQMQNEREWVRTKVAETVRAFDAIVSVALCGNLEIEFIVQTIGLAVYKFPKINGEEYKNKELSLFITQVPASSVNLLQITRKIESVWLARDLVNLPPNYKNPEQLEAIVRSLPWRNTRITILQKSELLDQSFGLLLAVGAGSDIPPRVLILERLTETRPVEMALVGKGVTFDAGWLQIKPDSSMLDMKLDMAGAAVVVASFWYADDLAQIPVSAVGSIGLVENLLGGSAFKPLDVLTSYSGKTVEVHHTDAEGRLVLGDLVSHIAQRAQPKNIITFATLTGACMHALGYNYAGLMGNNESLITKIHSLTEPLPEKVWRLPLDAAMIEATKSEIADYRNATSAHKAGASLGAAFIANFIPTEVAFAHLDIAAPAYRTKASGVFPSEATGFGVLTGIALLGL